MSRLEQQFCKRGHERTAENLTNNRACRLCLKETTKQWRLNNPEKVKEMDKNKVLRNIEKIKERRKKHYQENIEQIKERNEKWRKNNKDKHNKSTTKYYKNNPDKARNRQLKHSYNITLEQYNEMLVAQNNVCMICKNSETENKNFAVDHNHNTGKVRGLLCSACNKSLGGFKDNVNILQNAIEYLKKDAEL